MTLLLYSRISEGFVCTSRSRGFRKWYRLIQAWGIQKSLCRWLICWRTPRILPLFGHGGSKRPKICISRTNGRMKFVDPSKWSQDPISYMCFKTCIPLWQPEVPQKCTFCSGGHFGPGICQIGLQITIFVKNGGPMSIICHQTWLEWLIRLLRYSKYSL